MIYSAVIGKKTLTMVTLLIGLSTSAAGYQAAGQPDDQASSFVLTTVQPPEFAESVVHRPALVHNSSNPTKSEPAQDILADDVNLWQYLRNRFELKYSKPDDKRIERYETQFASYPQYFEQISKRAYWYLPYIVRELERRDLPYELAIIPIVESSFRPTAASSARAVGLWQFIPSTGKKYGLRQDWWIDERKDVVESTRAALDYLSYLTKEFENDWELALASYNAGSGRVRKAINANLRSNRPATFPYLKLPRETRNYLPKLLAIRNIIINPEKYGISLYPVPKKSTIAVVDAEFQTDLSVVAALTPLSPSEIQKLNPGYLRGVTPPDGPHHIVVPAKHALALTESLAETKPWNQLKWGIHRIRPGEYLGKIAALYNTKISILKSLNNLESDLIFPDQILKIPVPVTDTES